MLNPTVSLHRYQPRFLQGVVDLILPIQTEEFGIAITAEQQPDLAGIETFYQRGMGDFWIALAGDKVVGCIGLKDIGHQQGALRKMFVASDYRGKDYGVANALLNTLLGHASQRKLATLWLGTTDKFLAAHRFYEKNGFQEVSMTTLPAGFPLMAVDSKFYRLSLPK